MRAWGATGPVGVALLAAMGLAATNAGAASVTLDRSCYSPGDTVTETGAGFSPNGGVGRQPVAHRGQRVDHHLAGA